MGSIMSDVKRFKDMCLGDEYQGVYSFSTEEQGLDEIAALMRHKGNKELLKKKYEDEVEVLQQQLWEAKQEVEKYTKGAEHYDEALFQAHRALEVVRMKEEENRRRWAKRKRSPSPEAADGCTEAVEVEESPVMGEEEEVNRGRARTIDEGMVQRSMAKLVAGGLQPWWRVQPPGPHYPPDCTLVVDGIPWKMTESLFLPILLSAYDHWEVPHQRFVGINISREWDKKSGAYVNRGEVFIRFANQEYLREYMGLVEGRELQCDVSGRNRFLRVRRADKDLVVNSVGRDYMAGPRFGQDIWEVRDNV